MHTLSRFKYNYFLQHKPRFESVYADDPIKRDRHRSRGDESHRESSTHIDPKTGELVHRTVERQQIVMKRQVNGVF